MRIIWAVAQTAIKESLRSRILYFIFAIALLCIVFGKGCNPGRVTGGALLVNAATRQNFAMAAAFHLIVFWSITLGGLLSTGVLSKELDEGTLIMVLSRPVNRSLFVTGKLLATLLIAVLNLFVLGAIFFLLFYWEVGLINYRIFTGFALMICNLLMITVMGFMFTLFLPRLIASLIVFLIYLTSVWLEIPYYFEKIRAVWEPSSTMDRLHTIVPRIGALQFMGGTLIGATPPWSDLAVPLGNVLLYCSVFWLVIVFVFNRRQM